MKWNWILIAFFLLAVSCTTVPPENGPGEEPEPVPIPAPEPEPDEGRIMGYAPKPDGTCGRHAADPLPVPRHNGKCYDYENLVRFCQVQIYSDEPACLSIGAGRR